VGGDNLTVIAKKNQLTIAELAAANNLKTTATLHLGQKLIIPGKNPAPAKPAGSAKAGATNGTLSPDTPATAASKVPAEGLKHTVKPGESLGVIAQKYGVKVGDIAAANSITDPQKVKAGTELIIPGWQATGGKAPKAAPKAADDRTTTRASATPAPAPATVPTIDTAPRNQPSPGEVPVIQIEEAPAPSR
jgi:LysM repeat protein